MAERGGSEHLIIQTAFVGDLLLGIPLFKALRRLRPGDKITLVCRRGLGDFMVRAGLVDEAIEADKSSRASWAAATDRLKERRFEWLLCPHQSVRSSLLVSSLKADLKIGYRNGLFGLVFNRRVRRPLELPEALRQLALLMPVEDGWRERLESFARAQGMPGGQRSEDALEPVPEWAGMSVDCFARIRAGADRGEINMESLSKETADLARELSFGQKPLAVIAPGSVWTTKMWRREGFVEVARALASSGHQVVLMGAPDEKELCRFIADQVHGAVTIAGRSGLFGSAEVLALAQLLICNDSGAMHMAAAAGAPTVSIFGPTILEFGYRPWQNSASVVQVPRPRLTCRPCGKHGAKSCPQRTHECMQDISAQSVLTAANAFVKVSAARSP